MRRTLCAALSVSFSAIAGAQSPRFPATSTEEPPPGFPATIGIELPLGSSIGGGDDAILSVSLPFAFLLPDGTTTSVLDVTTNGIIYPGGSGVIDPTESVEEFANRVAIAPFWHDLEDFDGASNQVYFATLSPGATPTVAVITWLNVTVAGIQDPFTLQVLLFSSGDFSFRYDDRFSAVNVDGGLVGVSDGSGSAFVVDYSDLHETGGITVPRSAVEIFRRPAVVDFGRADELTRLNFSPTSPFSGYQLAGSVAPVAGVVPGQRACSSASLGFTITPNGSGFDLHAGAEFDPDYEMGTPFVLDRFDTVPFTSPFPVPIGDRILSNWEIFASGSIRSNDGGVSSSIAPASAGWSFFSAPNVWVHEIDSDTFSVTWRGLRQFMENVLPEPGVSPPANTFQAIVSSDGVIRFAYEELNFSVMFPVAGLTVGVFGGGGPGIHEVDFSSGSVSTSVPTIFESFDPFDLDELDLPRRLNEGRTVTVTSAPRIGTTLRATAFDPNGPQALNAFLLGLPAGGALPPVSLGPVDPHLASCSLFIDTIMTTPIISSAPPDPGGTLVVEVPVVTELIGAELSLQALILNPASSPSIMPTDQVLLRFGI